MLKNVKDSNGQPYVNQDGTLAVRKDNDFYQKDEYTGKKDLIAYHNISQENLDKAIQLGGLAVPSIAVTKKETDFSNFGDITLLMPQDMVNPKETPVYTRDAWTGVFPGILKASDEIEEEGEMGGFPGMEDMMGEGGGEEKRPPQMPPGNPPQMPKQTQDSADNGDSEEVVWRTTKTGRKYRINTKTGRVVGGSPVMPIGKVVTESTSKEETINYEKMKFKDLSKAPMVSKINSTGVNKFPEQVFKNLSKAKNHYEKHKKDLLAAGIHSYEEYLQATKKTIESAVGGEINGHENGMNQIVRYNTKINLFVKVNPDRGVFTSFVPEGEPGEYYQVILKGDLKHGGKR